MNFFKTTTAAFVIAAISFTGCRKDEPVKNVTGVSLNESTLTLLEGQTTTLVATVMPDDAADKTVTWAVTGGDAATVSDAGVVIAIKAGTATVTVTTADGGKTDRCTITIEKQTEPVEWGDVGPISGEEFAALPCPETYDEFAEILQECINENPSLETNEDETEFILAIVDKLKTKQQSTTEVTFMSLNRMELWYMITSPLISLEVFLKNKAHSVSLMKAVEAFSCENPNDPDAVKQIDNKMDAYRHGLWNILMAKHGNLEFAENIATAHEWGNTDKDAETMDLSNNAFARRLAEYYPDATIEELSDILLHKKMIYIPRGEPIPDNLDGLVYIADQAQYDVTLTGTFTNPDLGANVVWDCTMTMHQCGDMVRGTYTIVRDESFQERRFSGTVQNGSVVLDISYPYAFETEPGAGNPCSNMKMTLTGDENSLSGKWTSSNCYRGGQVSLNK